MDAFIDKHFKSMAPWVRQEEDFERKKNNGSFYTVIMKQADVTHNCHHNAFHGKFLADY